MSYSDPVSVNFFRNTKPQDVPNRFPTGERSQANKPSDVPKEFQPKPEFIAAMNTICNWGANA